MTERNPLDVAAREWGKQTARKLRARVDALTLSDKVKLARTFSRISFTSKGKLVKSPPLAESIGSNVKTNYGIPYRINFPFTRHGIFFDRGVGKNRPQGSGKERPHPFLAPVIEPSIEELAAMLAEASADAVLSEIKFVIPGTINLRVKIQNNG